MGWAKEHTGGNMRETTRARGLHALLVTSYLVASMSAAGGGVRILEKTKQLRAALRLPEDLSGGTP